MGSHGGIRTPDPLFTKQPLTNRGQSVTRVARPGWPTSSRRLEVRMEERNQIPHEMNVSRRIGSPGQSTGSFDCELRVFPEVFTTKESRDRDAVDSKLSTHVRNFRAASTAARLSALKGEHSDLKRVR